MQMNNYLGQSPCAAFFYLIKGGNIWHIRTGRRNGRQQPTRIVQPEYELRYIESVPEFVFT